MKRLRQIVEVFRDSKRAIKLANYVFKRNPRTPPPSEDGTHKGFNLLSKSSYIPSNEIIKKVGNDSANEKLGTPIPKEHNIPIHKIYTNQSGIDPKTVETNIHDYETTPHLIHHVKTDTYHVVDGNHRINSDIFRGMKKISARITKDYS